MLGFHLEGESPSFLSTVPGRQGRQKLNKKIEIEKNEKLLERRVEKNNYSLKSMPNIK
jgi:hypothetical protein